MSISEKYKVLAIALDDHFAALYNYDHDMDYERVEKVSLLTLDAMIRLGLLVDTNDGYFEVNHEAI
jgi:hypothetical protein